MPEFSSTGRFRERGSQRIPGIACIVGAVTLFVLQDALIKWLSGDYPLHEIVLVRSVIAIAIVLFVMRIEGGIHLLRTRRPGLQLARCALLVAANSTFYLALAAMTIAEATSLFFVAPLLITALSALVLRETVGPRRWTAMCIGLAGGDRDAAARRGCPAAGRPAPALLGRGVCAHADCHPPARHDRSGLHDLLLRAGGLHRHQRGHRPSWRGTGALLRRTVRASRSCCVRGRFPRSATPRCFSPSGCSTGSPAT